MPIFNIFNFWGSLPSINRYYNFNLTIFCACSTVLIRFMSKILQLSVRHLKKRQPFTGESSSWDDLSFERSFKFVVIEMLGFLWIEASSTNYIYLNCCVLRASMYLVRYNLFVIIIPFITIITMLLELYKWMSIMYLTGNFYTEKK